VKVLEVPTDDGSTNELIRLLVIEEVAALVILMDDTDLVDL